MFDREPSDEELDDDFEEIEAPNEDDLEDEEDLENLEDHLDEDEAAEEEEELQDDDALEDDPWEKQIRMNKTKGSRKDNLW